MALYHIRARTVSRASGASAAAAAAYILRLGRYAKADHDPCLFSHAGNMPAWAADPRRRLGYWSAADAHERANGRLFKSLEFALPRELSHAQRVALAREFCERVARTDTGEPLPFLMAVHKGKGGNPHAHVMVSERVLDGHDRRPDLWFSRAAPRGKKPEAGGARKTKSLMPRDWLLSTRELLAWLTNETLAAAGSTARVDHRSLAAQGITDRMPGVHLGPAGAARLRRGARSRRADELAEQQGEALAARGLADELAREAGQATAELAALQATAAPSRIGSGTAGMLARAERAAGRRNSSSPTTTKERGNDYANPGLR